MARMNKKGGRPDRPGETLKRLFAYFNRGYMAPFVGVLISILFSTAGSVAASFSLKYIIDDFIMPMASKADPDFGPMIQALKVLAIIFLVGIVATYLRQRLMSLVSQGVLRDLRNDMFVHLQKLPIRFYDENSHGTIMSLFTNDAGALRQMLNQSVPQVLQSSLMIIANFVAMIVLSPLLVLVTIVMVGVMALSARFIVKNSGKYFVTRQAAIGEVSGYVQERMAGQKVVKVFNHEDVSKEEFDEVNERLFESTAKAHGFANMTGPVIGNVGNLQFVVTAVFGGIMAIMGVGGITFGVLAAYLQFSKGFTQPIMQVGQQFNSIVMALAGAERIFKMLDQEPEVDEGTVTLVNTCRGEHGELRECTSRTGTWAWKKEDENGNPEYVELKGDVRFIDMSFGYEPDDEVLHDLNLYAKPGQKLAFVGSTGAGKTTIMNLVNRFYDVDEGRIIYDGIDVKDIKKADLRKSLGIVLQETHLFTGTIAENIRYGNPDATDEQVRRAAKLAYADTFIERLPEGYDTMLTGDGEELSQGQRQLLAIARAAVANAPVLILDEATSSIDTRTEAIVQQGMDNLMKGRTVFVIAHRLSTIKNSDAIIVLEHGRIIERGDHESLMAKKGTYYQFYTGKIELE